MAQIFIYFEKFTPKKNILKYAPVMYVKLERSNNKILVELWNSNSFLMCLLIYPCLWIILWQKHIVPIMKEVIVFEKNYFELEKVNLDHKCKAFTAGIIS